ncbi:MAG TPA: uroporphyrinogen decarboxylase family protein [Planctomycetota bacterium]|nr:uroporphyrinogen decarboxylase family protein [Planctomycetota bacterium]
MNGSSKLVYDACRGARPDRTPVFDILCNDAVVEHFAGRPFDGTDDEAIAFAAAREALDGSRGLVPRPAKEGTESTDEMGNVRVSHRWTGWIKVHALTTPEQWAQWIRGHVERLDAEPQPTPERAAAVVGQQQAFNERLGDTVFIHCTPSTAINTAMFGFCGLEMFSYLWADERELVLRWLRALERQTYRGIELGAHAETCRLAMIYSDVAFKGRLMFSKAMFNEIGFFDDVAEICRRCHERGQQVIFHSDGYVMDIMDDLIAAGIDGLNPIEKAAGMDIYEIRRRWPQVILVGGVDVTHLLPTGTPEAVRRETRRIISECGSEGRLLIGSSTELENNVPLENYLAFHDEVMRG